MSRRNDYLRQSGGWMFKINLQMLWKRTLPVCVSDPLYSFWIWRRKFFKFCSRRHLATLLIFLHRACFLESYHWGSRHCCIVHEVCNSFLSTRYRTVHYLFKQASRPAASLETLPPSPRRRLSYLTSSSTLNKCRYGLQCNAEQCQKRCDVKVGNR